MAKVSNKETKPEILVRKFLFSRGYRYRKNVVSMPGKPDIVLPKYRTVIFVNGCFWHGHKDCKKAKLPSSNIAFWKEKITKNIERDHNNINVLLSLNWNVITIWECEIMSVSCRERRFQKLEDEIVTFFNDL